MTKKIKPSDIKNGGGNYCSHICQEIAKRNKVKIICEVCGKEKEIIPSIVKRGDGKYCSLKCRQIAQRGEKSHFWKGGISNNSYPRTWTKGLRNLIRDRDNNRCIRCNRAREEFKQALSIHHIDADKDNCNPQNLITLCDHVSGSCHGLTRGKEELFAKGFRNILTRLYGYEYI